MSKSRGRRKRIPPERKRSGSWFARLSPEVRVIGLVVLIMGIAMAIVLWPWQKEKLQEPLTVVIPADEPTSLAFREARRSFMAQHKDLDVVLIEAEDAKLQAYEAMWRKGKSGVDLVIGGEAYLARWAAAGMLEPWDDFLSRREVRLSSAALEAGRLGTAQQMLPVAMELPSIAVFAPGAVSPPDSLDALASLASRLSAAGSPALGANWTGQWAEAVLAATAAAGVPQERTLNMLIGGSEGALAWWRRGIAEGWARKPGAGAPRPPLLWAGETAWFGAGDAGGARLLLPPGAAQNGTVCVAYGAQLPKQSKRKEAARSFAGDLLLLEKFQLALAQRAGLLPAVIGVWPKLKGAEWQALTAVAARSIPLSAELRSADVAERFAQTTVRCLNGETPTATAAAELARLSGARAVAP